MSTLKADLLQGATNPAKPPLVEKSDFVRSWGRFGSSGSIFASFGISSVSDVQAGLVEVAVANPVSGGSVTAGSTSLTSGARFSTVFTPSNRAATHGYQIAVYSTAGALIAPTVAYNGFSYGTLA